MGAWEVAYVTSVNPLKTAARLGTASGFTYDEVRPVPEPLDAPPPVGQGVATTIDHTRVLNSAATDFASRAGQLASFLASVQEDMKQELSDRRQKMTDDFKR